MASHYFRCLCPPLLFSFLPLSLYPFLSFLPLFLPLYFYPPSLSPLPSLPPQLLKKLKRPHEAVLNLSWALDFSRSGGSCHIREEVDQLYQMNSREEAGEADDLFTVHSDTEEEGEEEEEG